MQADECRKFLAELEGGRAPPPSAKLSAPVVADARMRLGLMSLARESGKVMVTVALVEPMPDRVFAGRVIIDQAKDDAGVTLLPEQVPMLAPVAVGRTSEAEMQGLHNLRESDLQIRGTLGAA